MTTRAQAAKLIDDAADTVLAGYPVLHGNQLDVTQSQGETSYVRQRTYFPETSQLFLGNQDSDRTRGTVVFTIYVRRGKGDGDRNVIANLLAKGIKSKRFGGVNFMGIMKEMPNQDTENWCLTGVQIPFYFDEV